MSGSRELANDKEPKRRFSMLLCQLRLFYRKCTLEEDNGLNIFCISFICDYGVFHKEHARLKRKTGLIIIIT
jgi:hypothetical protein